MNKISNMIWGCALILLGVIIGFNAFGITNINIFFDGWWTFFIIIPCLIGLTKNQDKTGDYIGLVIGILLLCSCQNLLDFAIIWKLMLPIILVSIGLSIVLKDVIGENVRKKIKELNKDDQKEYCATFGAQTLDFAKEKFDGANLSAVFGAVKCDLKDAIIKKDVVIKASSIFGGITIIVPDDVNVKISSIPIFGGVSDERKKKTNDAKQTIYINATCMFGGIDIK